MTNSWQVSTFSNVHQCPPRRDDKLVTVKRITQKYEKLILDNPTWSMERLKATVQEEMLAYVSISKCNRAKSTVMSKILDAREGEHSRVFDYQQELLRSNSGNTVVMKLDHDFEDLVFQRFYVCFEACKRGFLARYVGKF